MNRTQMKSAIAKFMSADVSVIKDDALRAKAQKLQAKQKGFTLLELLVVITLLATIATAGLVAYEGIGENATDTAAANNLMLAESSIRNYRAIEDKYPNQFDNLANADGTLPATTGIQSILADKTKAYFGQWAAPVADTVLVEVAEALEEVGIDELQTLPSAQDMTDAVPNLALNESGGYNASELSLWDDTLDVFTLEYNDVAVATPNIGISIVPSGGNGTQCQVGTTSLRANFDGVDLADSANLNLINDAIDSNACTLVLALGVGKDVPGTTIDSRVAISQVPTVATKEVNPSKNYARAIALFQVAEDGANGGTVDGTITSDEVFGKARLIGMVDPEGRGVDTALAAANAESNN